jgi:UDP-N-acetylmuramate: L-alanyl-gamma-D-glutamyl-meso-diaminopimelate ligase
MAKADFHFDAATHLSELPKNARIHFIGVCGVAMAPLAIGLAAQGYRVSGSDKEFYEPMGTLLKNSSITLYQGYAAENITSDMDLVVIGNAIPYDFVEMGPVEALKLKYTSSAQLLADAILRDKHTIVVTGTHGKSTTSALTASVLRTLKKDPSYFVGALPVGFPLSFHAGLGDYSVVEGDEYDTAFFAKVPKFRFYLPQTVITTSIEFDHADIYPDLEHIVTEFRTLALAIPTTGRWVACLDCTNIQRIIQELHGKMQAPLTTYGESADADYRLVRTQQNGLSQTVFFTMGGREYSFALPLPGIYNAKNALSIVAALHSLQFPMPELLQAFADFKGLKRRQEVCLDKNGITIISDFAHHPTAVRETISAIRAAYPHRRLWAIFDPRSTTSRRKVFQKQYIEAFQNANEAIISAVENRAIDKNVELLDVTELAQMIAHQGTPAVALAGPDAIFEHLKNSLQSGDVALIMTNGGFGGLVQRLTEAFS